MTTRNQHRVRNLGDRVDFEDWTTEVTGALDDHVGIYDGLGPGEYDDYDVDCWVSSSRMGTVLAIGFGVLVVVLVVAQFVMAVRR